MANYAKRDARKEWVAAMADSRGDRLAGPALPACWCGEIAVIEVYTRGEMRYFCKAHEAEGMRAYERRRWEEH